MFMSILKVRVRRPNSKLAMKTSESTAFSVRTVYCVINDKEDLGEGKFESPVKRYHKTSRKKILCFDYFDVAAVKRMVHLFYNCKEYPAMTNLQQF